jgi:rfaE bifunctional protein nucleotidyltransferase chain/domain
MKNIWTNGCFDVLHVGHIRLLKYAKSLGSRLYVGIDSDERIKQSKGKDRPINNVADRAEMLQELKCVTGVAVFNTDDELCNAIKCLGIDTMVIGEEYKNKRIIGKDYAKDVLFFPKVNGYSSTGVISCSQKQTATKLCDIIKQ